MVPDTAITGHNNEQMTGVTVEQCEAACCARDWCKSFDFTDTDNHCNLADVDATRQFGETTSDGNWALYERPDTGAVAPPLGADGCSAMLSEHTERINAVCCGGMGEMCADGTPRTCSSECAAEWMPFALECSEVCESRQWPYLVPLIVGGSALLSC